MGWDLLLWRELRRRRAPNQTYSRKFLREQGSFAGVEFESCKMDQTHFKV